MGLIILELKSICTLSIMQRIEAAGPRVNEIRRLLNYLARNSAISMETCNGVNSREMTAVG
jgi:hypothetical protein